MNYIKQLQAEVEAKQERIEELEQVLTNLATYLALPKFSEETWVSKYDILRHIGRY